MQVRRAAALEAQFKELQAAHLEAVEAAESHAAESARLRAQLDQTASLSGDSQVPSKSLIHSHPLEFSCRLQYAAL